MQRYEDHCVYDEFTQPEVREPTVGDQETIQPNPGPEVSESPFDPTMVPAYGETWAEYFEAPNYAHTFNDRGFMTVNSTFDGAIGGFGDSDWIRIQFEQGHTYKIQMYSFSVESFLGLADNNGNPLTSDTYETVTVNGLTYAVCTIEFTATRTGTHYIVAEEQGHNGMGAYTVGVVETTQTGSGPLKTWTLDQVANRLTDSGWEFFGGERRSWDQDTITYDVTGIGGNARQLVKHAFDAWSKLTGLTFKNVTSTNPGSAKISFDDNDPGKAYAASKLNPSGSLKSVEINVAKDWETSNGTTLDSYTFQTYMHEIGHAIGLAHAGDYNAGQGGPVSYPDSVLYFNDSWNTTIMSYVNQSMNTRDKSDYALVMTPMIADVIAVHDLYGMPSKAYHGNTRYGVNSNTGDYMDLVFGALCEGQTSSPLIAGNRPLSFTLWDTGGRDVVDLSTDTAAQRVDLRATMLSDIYGTKGAMVIARGTTIENFIAGKKNDTVTGNGASNKIEGRLGHDKLIGLGGNDTLNGGIGKDTLNGGLGNDLMIVDNIGDKVFGGSGIDKVNSLVNFTLGTDVENLSLIGARHINGTGNNGANTIIGNAGSNVLTGKGGNDKLFGGAHNDKLFGQNGNDLLDGGAGRDTMSGGAGNDLMIVNSGGDKALGGAGVDRVQSSVSFALANDVENLSLAGSKNINGTGNGAGNTIAGNVGKNILSGENGRDKLSGNNGSDTLYGGGHNDSLYGGNSSDLFNGGAGNDQLFGGAGASDMAAYSGGIGRYTITELSGGRVKVVDKNGTFGTDILTSIEKLKFGSKVYKTGDVASAQPPQNARAGDDDMTYDPADVGDGDLAAMAAARPLPPSADVPDHLWALAGTYFGDFLA